ncbi:MAG: hypothetical protein ACI8W8_002212 [Rhodothermales bacterium]
MAPDDNPYAPPSASAVPDLFVTESTAAGSRIDIRPRNRFNGEFLRQISRRLAVLFLLIPLVFPGAILHDFSPGWGLLVGIICPCLIVAFPLRSFYENTRARCRFVSSLEQVGQPVELSFEPRLPCAPDELRDSADDMGALTLDADGLSFHGDHVDCEVRNCDFRSARFGWHLKTLSGDFPFLAKVR